MKALEDMDLVGFGMKLNEKFRTRTTEELLAMKSEKVEIPANVLQVLVEAALANLNVASTLNQFFAENGERERAEFCAKTAMMNLCALKIADAFESIETVNLGDVSGIVNDNGEIDKSKLN